MSDALTVAKNAALIIDAMYQWVDRVEKAGGATSIQGVAACHAMLKSFKQNKPRIAKLVSEPLGKIMDESAPP